MSKYTAKGQAITVPALLKRKAEAKKLSMITCYDAAFAHLIDQTGIDVVLVGDSLGNVMLGYENTIGVSLDEMIHHTAAVARVLTKPLLTADMPFFTYHVSREEALRNAARLVQKGGAQAVKLEGGQSIAGVVEALVTSGIPVMGHLGLTPQSVHALGGYRVQGRGDAAHKRLLADAKALEQAGAFAVVLELIPAALAEEVTAALSIPTIGIGAGPHCDGQVLVLQDMLGFDDALKLKFLKKYANLGSTIKDALAAYDREVKDGAFPTLEHSFNEGT